ncbi:hypothetical protein AVDCRST_MAG84-6219 [uncultured Microcoleus sp.]|uniref:Uncharacterized protein n=1 Tax=uncultured Microcoleus sp. TaxID=259945 RepID=A0A6J4P2N7_9CYAN|nr:hypothetical protein AVDCRST_MAG84-6219 [uncultured Microcoleus sp.]
MQLAEVCGWRILKSFWELGTLKSEFWQQPLSQASKFAFPP